MVGTSNLDPEMAIEMGFPKKSSKSSWMTAGAMHAALLAAEPTLHAREGSPAGASQVWDRHMLYIYTNIWYRIIWILVMYDMN